MGPLSHGSAGGRVLGYNHHWGERYVAGRMGNDGKGHTLLLQPQRGHKRLGRSLLEAWRNRPTGLTGGSPADHAGATAAAAATSHSGQHAEPPSSWVHASRCRGGRRRPSVDLWRVLPDFGRVPAAPQASQNRSAGCSSQAGAGARAEQLRRRQGRRAAAAVLQPQPSSSGGLACSPGQLAARRQQYRPGLPSTARCIHTAHPHSEHSPHIVSWVLALW